MIVLCASILPVVILFCGLCIDSGMMQFRKIQMQNAADAGALGAELEQERGTWNWVAMGKSDAALNGFSDGTNNTTISVAQTSTFGAYTTYYNAIQVTISQRVRTIFMGSLNGGYQTVTASAVALIPPCVNFLGTGALSQNTFQNASATMNTNCPVQINHSAVVDGFSSLYAFGINIAGTVGSSNLSGTTSQQEGWWAPGAPTFNQPAGNDPLAYIPQPALGACNATGASITSGTATLYPGVYCGTSSTPGVTISNATVTLLPGLYVITGGALVTNSTITGSGVTIFFTKGTNGAGYGQMHITRTGNQTSTLNISAPTTNAGGGIPGVLFFFDRSWVATSAQDVSFDTSSTFSGDGIWYMPKTGLYFWSNSFTVPNYGGFVADNIYFFGTNIQPMGNFSSIAGGSPFRTQAVLVQ